MKKLTKIIKKKKQERVSKAQYGVSLERRASVLTQGSRSGQMTENVQGYYMYDFY